MPTSPEEFLDTAEGAGRVMAHARLILKLARRLERVLPEPLGTVARVANFKSGRIVIHAENGAVAAKIRQMGPRLCSELSVEGLECNGIEVKVQPRQIPWQSRASQRNPLSGGAVGSLRAIATTLPPGPLRAALETLLARSGNP
jgi:hypothetical protein